MQDAVEAAAEAGDRDTALQGLEEIDRLADVSRRVEARFTYVLIVDAFTWNDPESAKTRRRLLRRAEMLAHKRIEDIRQTEPGADVLGLEPYITREQNLGEAAAELADIRVRLDDKTAANKAIDEVPESSRDLARLHLATLRAERTIRRERWRSYKRSKMRISPRERLSKRRRLGSSARNTG